MSRFAVVVMLPEAEAGRLDFNSREFDTWAEFAEFMEEAEKVLPSWRIVSVCHVEDLPMLMEPGP